MNICKYTGRSDVETFFYLQNSTIFHLDELQIMQSNASAMQLDIRHRYRELLDSSHSGQPVIVEEVRTGRAGRPAIYIDPDFLRWAYSMRSTSSIAEFLGVSRSTVRTALLQYGIAQPQDNPFASRAGGGGGNGEEAEESQGE